MGNSNAKANGALSKFYLKWKMCEKAYVLSDPTQTSLHIFGHETQPGVLPLWGLNYHKIYTHPVFQETCPINDYCAGEKSSGRSVKTWLRHCKKNMKSNRQLQASPAKTTQEWLSVLSHLFSEELPGFMQGGSESLYRLFNGITKHPKNNKEHQYVKAGLLHYFEEVGLKQTDDDSWDLSELPKELSEDLESYGDHQLPLSDFLKKVVRFHHGDADSQTKGIDWSSRNVMGQIKDKSESNKYTVMYLDKPVENQQ